MSEPISIMVIDDEMYMRRLIKRMLDGSEFTVLEMATGTEALKALNEAGSLPDVITCDIAMPDMDGFEILQKIKQNPALADIPVVMLTAMGQLDEAKKAKDMGASDYITKPFSTMGLIEVLKGHVFS